MKKSMIITVFIAVTSFLISVQAQARNFEMFSLDYDGCYDRPTEDNNSFVVDSHIHFQPFGGKAIPFDEMLGFLQKEGIYFANVYGIGQKLPADSPCGYYLDCPGTTVTPSITNDFVNASNIANRLPDKMPKNLHLTLSMSFTNLVEPETIVPQIQLLDREFPGMFKWMGEINVVKQAIFPNGHFAASAIEIAQWYDFMRILEKRNMPVSFHCDLGNDKEKTKYLPLMEQILKTYPGNIIVWHHLGLSKELANFNPKEHIDILKTLLDKHPNLYLDISWNVLYKYYFKDKMKREFYIEFFNNYSKRILPGTDFLASEKKTYEDYKNEVSENSYILQFLNDEAFRNIALGQNYFNILALPYKAPEICEKTELD